MALLIAQSIVANSVRVATLSLLQPKTPHIVVMPTACELCVLVCGPCQPALRQLLHADMELSRSGKGPERIRCRLLDVAPLEDMFLLDQDPEDGPA